MGRKARVALVVAAFGVVVVLADLEWGPQSIGEECRLPPARTLRLPCSVLPVLPVAL